MYSYKEALKEDIRNWMEENHTEGESKELKFDYDKVYDACFMDDSVTGNASGSYTFSRAQARQYFFEDENSEDYIYQMLDEGFSSEADIGHYMATSDWEVIDVLIRCYLLGEAVQEVLDEMDF